MTMPLAAEGKGRLRSCWWRKGTVLANDLTTLMWIILWENWKSNRQVVRQVLKSGRKGEHLSSAWWIVSVRTRAASGTWGDGVFR